jgi:WD40 repeat protein
MQPPKDFNPSISDRVNAAVMKGMALNYEFRPQSVQEFLDLLGINIAVVSPPTSKLQPIITPLSSSKFLVNQAYTWECLHTISRIYTTFAISPNGKILAAVAGRSIDLIEIQTGKFIRNLTVYSSDVKCIAFSPNGQILASGNDDKTIKLWDIKTGSLLRSLTKTYPNNVYSVAFSSNNQILGHYGREIKLWDLDLELGIIQLWKIVTKTNFYICELEKNTNLITLSPDGKILAAETENGIELWDMQTFKRIRKLVSRSLRESSIAFSSDGETLSSCYGKVIELYDVRTGKLIRTITDDSCSFQSVTFSPEMLNLVIKLYI